MFPRKSRYSKNSYGNEQLRMLLREVRLKVGLRQVDLANRLGTPQSFVSKYETGERSLDIMELLSICNALGLPLTDLIQKLEERLVSKDET